MKHFIGSFIFAVIALIVAMFIGYTGTLASSIDAMFTVLMLGVLESSLSVDNAVVNARILSTMDAFWQKMFLTVGMLIAVFGMRVVFPIVIVWTVGDASLVDVMKMVVYSPETFRQILVDQHIVIAGFGGAFLMMVFANFFIDNEKEHHWLPFIENVLSKIGSFTGAWIAIVVASIVFVSRFIESTHRHGFISSAMIGVATYWMVHGLSGLLEKFETKLDSSTVKKSFTAGIISFMYLEILDASFSFDGVIGAFAITNNLFIIALGLGIGAMFVRSMTIKLVRDNTLTEYIYLEHGAFWAMGALAIIMFISAIGVEIPEFISGSIGMLFIAISFYASINHNKKQKGA